MKTQLSLAVVLFVSGCSMVGALVPMKKSPAPGSQSAGSANRKATPLAEPPGAPAANPAFSAALDQNTREALELLNDTSKGDMWPFGSQSTFSERITAIAALEKFDALCKDPSVTPKPAVRCKLVADRVAIAMKFAEHHAGVYAAQYAKTASELIASVKGGDMVRTEDHNYLLHPETRVANYQSQWSSMLAPLAVKLDDKVWQPYVDAAAAYPAALAEAAKVSRWEKDWKNTDAIITAHVKKDHSKGGALDPGKVAKIGSAKQEWSILRNEFGTITGRDWYNMFVLVQVTGEDYCRLYQRGFTSQYDGSKYLLPNGADGYARFQISSCN